ncbi:replication-associated recombination protein A [bacterium]|nr:replication-associated recombination protein A [bacterium]
MDLFDNASEKQLLKKAPLADRLRPTEFSDFSGQKKLIAESSPLRKLITEDKIPSMILWGPPGTGKTTLARIIARLTGKEFNTLSAVSSGVKDVRNVVSEAEKRLKFSGRGTILFIDEIHRFNKAQQDAFLPYVESGMITLIGATTENPSFEVINALLSRCQVYILEPLSIEDLKQILSRALKDKESGLGELDISITDEALDAIVHMSDGDARYSLNILETAAFLVADQDNRVIDAETIVTATQSKLLRYDRAGEEHYNIISALHKSMRGSDVDASLYWMCRMLEAGEDPLYVVRRIIRFASEDIGNADPEALKIALAAQQAVHFVGMPEAGLAIAQAVSYMATAPKSNSLYTAYKKIQKTIAETGALGVPKHIRNAPTKLMKDIGYGKDYKYAHNYETGFVSQDYLPEELRGSKFYFPKNIGFERDIIKRIKYWEKLKSEEKER